MNVSESESYYNTFIIIIKKLNNIKFITIFFILLKVKRFKVRNDRMLITG